MNAYRLTRALLIAVLLSLCPLAVSGQSFDFKGIELGVRTTTAAIEQKLGIKCRVPEGDQACAGNSTMMRLPARVYIDILAGAVARIDVSFDAMLFEEAAKSLNQKYGPPFRKKATMRVWRNKRGDLVILERNGLLSFRIKPGQCNFLVGTCSEYARKSCTDPLSTGGSSLKDQIRPSPKRKVRKIVDTTEHCR